MIFKYECIQCIVLRVSCSTPFSKRQRNGKYYFSGDLCISNQMIYQRKRELNTCCFYLTNLLLYCVCYRNEWVTDGNEKANCKWPISVDN